MGAAIAAHLANAGLRVRLLDIPAKDAPAGDRAARNKIAAAGLEGARKAKPAAFFSPRFDTLVSVGNLEDDLAAAVAASDVVIEAIIENLAIKQALYQRIDEMGGRAIITSNTSGLRIADLMQGRSADFRGRFCITHFFNPPRYLKLVEIVAGADTKPETIARAEALCGDILGKGLVRAKDTPNFIANRIGTFAMMRTRFNDQLLRRPARIPRLAIPWMLRSSSVTLFESLAKTPREAHGPNGALERLHAAELFPCICDSIQEL